ncbi:eukaryotic aspartyl protease family protein [Actinidia rufa]|uniref:Eukaryotic aspartyl protease family protein n=1 Tax=Actinidia rufa TaxID=165716 RepID=A0A7J0EF33_9ERIC|nr:eukaryotic aspartyl protease family protein [Actinidia rufa]
MHAVGRGSVCSSKVGVHLLLTLHINIGSFPGQQRRTETKPQPVKIKLQEIFLNLIPSDHDRSDEVHTSINKPQTQHINVMFRIHHRVRPEDAPNHACALQHQINLRHAVLASEALRAVTELKRRYGRHSRHACKLVDESPSKGLIDGRLHDRVRVYRADPGPSAAGFVDRQQGFVERHDFIVDFDGCDADKVVGRGLAVGEAGGGADGVNDERRVGKKLGGVDIWKENIGAVSEEHDAFVLRRRGQADGEFFRKAKGRCELGRHRNVGDAEAGHALDAGSEALYFRVLRRSGTRKVRRVVRSTVFLRSEEELKPLSQSTHMELPPRSMVSFTATRGVLWATKVVYWRVSKSFKTRRQRARGVQVSGQMGYGGWALERVNWSKMALWSQLRNRQRKSLSPSRSTPISTRPRPWQLITDQRDHNIPFGLVDNNVKELGACCNSTVADVEEKISGSTVILRMISRRIPGQVVKIINVLEKFVLRSFT